MHLLPQPLFGGDEGLRVVVTREGFADFRAPDCGATLTPERACALAFDLLGVYSPEAVELLRAALRRSHLRVVGVGDGPEAA